MATLQLKTDAEKRTLARNLQIHAWYLSVVNNGSIFDHNLFEFRVQRGVYTPGPTESPSSGSTNQLSLTGRAVVYEFVNKSTGVIDVRKTYELAMYLKDFLPFDKLILDFDTFDPSGKMAAAIIIHTPEIPETYIGIRYNNTIETRFNNKVVATGSLIDVSQPPGTVVDARSDLGQSANGISGRLPADGVVLAQNPDPNKLPKQNIIDAVAAAVRSLGSGFTATITPQGGIATRAAGTINHIRGDAMDHFLSFNGSRINPSQDPSLYRQYIRTLVSNARARGIRPGIGGYPSFIHYDESPWRQSGSGVAGTWNNGFDVTSALV